MKYIVIIIAMFAIACGNDTPVSSTVTNVTQVSGAPDASVNMDIAAVIAEENQYRLNTGSAPLVPGLVCSLYNVSTTTPSTIPANPSPLVASWVYLGDFNVQDSPVSIGMSVLPTALKSIYQTWYVIRCSGQIVSTSSDYELFKLTSDDGSNLYLDGALLVNNDGLHGTQLRTAQKMLKRSVHSFRLDYLQAGGNQSLLLENQSGIINSNRFYR